MRRSKTFAAALLTAGVTAMPFGSLAGAAPTQDPVAESACGTLGSLSLPLCQLVEEVEALLDPVDPVVEPVTEAVQPVLDTVGRVTDAVQPVLDSVGRAAGALDEALAPVTDAIPAPVAPASPAQRTPVASPAPAPAQSGSKAPSSSAKATSAGSYTGFSAALSSGASGFGRSAAAPSGFSLQLSPLGVPTLSIGSDFAAPALDSDLPLPEVGPFEPVIEAVRAGATSSDDSKATVAILALAALGMAAGMLIDQVRKAKAPFTIG